MGGGSHPKLKVYFIMISHNHGLFHRKRNGSMASAGACPWDDCVWQLDHWGNMVLHLLVKRIGEVPSQSLEWNLKMAPWNRRFLLETIIFGFHVKLGECICRNTTGTYIFDPFLGVQDVAMMFDPSFCWLISFAKTCSFF